MKKLIVIFLALSLSLHLFAAEPPEGSFSWGLTVPFQVDYLASETLSVTSATISQFTVSYELLDTAMAQYVTINGDVLTVIKHYGAATEATLGKIYLKAVISGMADYDDTEMVTYLTTRKIVPTLQWNCTLGDMLCGSSVHLSAVHGNTDRPDMEVTFTAADYASSPSSLVSIDQNTDMLTATNVGTGVYIIAKIDSTDNYRPATISYLRDDSIVRFNVLKGFRPISWDSTDFSSINNLSGTLPLRVIYPDSKDSVTITSDNPLVADVMPGNILYIYKRGQVRLTASVAGTDNYYDAVSDTLINIPAALPTVFWEEDVIRNMEKMKIVTSTTCGFSPKVWVNSNYGDDASYRFSIPESEKSIAQIVGDTALCCFSEGTIHLSVVAQAEGLTSVSSTHAINIGPGTLEFVKAGNWSDTTCWSRPDLASDIENFHVDIVNDCMIRNGSEARCRSLNIYANGNLTIEPEARLMVDSLIDNFGGEQGLLLKADRNHAAQVIFAEGSPLATVEMYLNHSLVNGRDTLWCSHGVSVDKGTIRSYTGKLRVKSWNDRWIKKSGNKIPLDAFEGYLITDTLAGVYSVDGRLLAGDKTFTLRCTAGDESTTGRNFLTNSYAASVNISALEFENTNAELFEYVNRQYRTLPKYTAFTLGHGQWLAGQSLFVKALSSDSRLTIDYDKAIVSEPEELLFNMLKISVRGNGGYSDTLVLMDAPFCSELYDDGYDGTKWAGDTCTPQLFANTPWGKANVNVEQSIVSQRIGFKAAREGETYIMKFDTTGLGGSYDHLYLFDTRNQTFTDIIAGENYQFTGSTVGENDRFTIMREKVVPKRDKNGRCIMVVGNKVLLVGFENSNVPVRVMNLEGKIVCEYNSKEGPWLELPQLITGIYLINAEKCSTKFYR